MTAVLQGRRAGLRIGSRVAGPVHPVDALRWLRNGILLCLVAAAAMYLLVVIQAGSDIAAAQRTQQAVNDLKTASVAVTTAGSALNYAFSREDPALVGTGSDFVNDITQVDKELTLAAESNAASTAGTSDIQYVENQLTSYQQLSETAVSDYEQSPAFGLVGYGYAAGAESPVQSAIDTLTGDEQAALSAQRGAWVLQPTTFWWVLLGPVIAFLLLVAATARVLASGFRRHVSPHLWGALLVTVATTVTVGFLNARDVQRLAQSRPQVLSAGDPVTMTIVLLLLLGAVSLAHLAYQPRLAEYRFRSS